MAEVQRQVTDREKTLVVRVEERWGSLVPKVVSSWEHFGKAKAVFFCQQQGGSRDSMHSTWVFQVLVCCGYQQKVCAFFAAVCRNYCIGLSL